MKQTLLIITLFISIGNVNAQSDATIHETIDWIKNYANDYAKSGLQQYLGKTIGNHESNFVFRVNNTELTILTYYNQNDDWAYAIINDYSVINKIELQSRSKNGLKFYFITFYTTSGKLIDVNLGKTVKSKITETNIILNNKSEAERIYRALEHFFKLIKYNPAFKNKLNLENKF